VHHRSKLPFGDKIAMNTKIKKWKRITWFITAPMLFSLAYVIYQFKTGTMDKQLATGFCLLILGTISVTEFIFSIATKHTYARHVLISKAEMPSQYYFMTAFYALSSSICFILSIRYL